MAPISIYSHPSLLLQKPWIDLIRDNAATAEHAKRLTSEQLELLYDQKWFLAIAPKAYGGLEWTLPEIVAFEEAIGWADGSMGWVFTLCSGAGWFGGFLDKNFAQSIFSAPKACLAGSGAATGTAAILPDGSYLVNGFWKYASGAPDATVFTANCQIVQEGKPVMENGEPLIIAFCFLENEVEKHFTWSEIGLVASAGHSFSVKDLKVGKERAFRIHASHRKILSPLFCFPFIQLAAATIAANYAGMCVHFIEEFTALIATKKGRDGVLLSALPNVQQLVVKSTESLDQIRKQLFAEVEKQWQIICHDNASDLPDSKIFPFSQELAHTCRSIVNQLFPYCGLTVMRPDTAISRVWRDFETGSQHALFCPA